MKSLHQLYREETGGRGMTFTVWLEKKLYEFSTAYDNLMDLVKAAHAALLTGSEDERHALAQAISDGFKDTDLFEDAAV